MSDDSKKSTKVDTDISDYININKSTISKYIKRWRKLEN